MGVLAQRSIAPLAAQGDPRHRALLGKVHVAKKMLGLTDDDYRAILLEETGHLSAKDCSAAQLTRVVERFKKRGFADKPKSPAGKAAQRRPADSPMAKKARAMWISLHQLGAIDNPAEPALEAFARGQLKCTAMQWADQSQAYKLIEALKAMAERHGWSQKVDADWAAGQKFYALKLHLVDAIMNKLKAAKIVPAGWNITVTAHRLCGIGDGMPRLWTVLELERIAAGLGAKLNEAKSKGVAI